MDACVSYYHHSHLGQDFYQFKEGDLLEEYTDLFQRGELMFGDFFTHLKVGRVNEKELKI